MPEHPASIEPLSTAEPLETAELVAFAKTVEAGSLSRAASELRIPRATLSRRLGRLEERLGARLIRRGTRGLLLTDAGETLLRHAHLVLDAVRQAEESGRRSDADAPRGDIRVSVPPMHETSFNAMVCRFARLYPDVRLHVHCTTQYTDLLRGGCDIALRVGTSLDPGLIARTLTRTTVIAVASPGYLETCGLPRNQQDLKQHRCLMGFAAGERPQTHWPSRSGLFHVEGSFFSNEIPLLRDAALAGLGIAVLPRFMVNAHLESGRLVHVLDELIGTESLLSVVYRERELMPRHVRLFIDAIVDWAREGI